MRNLNRTVFSIFLVVCVLTSGVGAFASEATNQGDYSVMWNNIDALGAGLTINSMGYATCTSVLEVTGTTNTATLYMYLQRYVNGTWTDVNSWSTSGSSYLSQTGHYYVTSGYDYRVHAISYIFSPAGTLLEIGMQDSKTVHY